MSGGSGGSGDGGGVRGDGGAHVAGPQEPQTPGCWEARTAAPSPGWAARRPRVAVGGAMVGTGGFWMEKRHRVPSLSRVCCGCTAEGAGGGPGVVSGRRPGRRVRLRHRCAELGGSRGI